LNASDFSGQQDYGQLGINAAVSGQGGWISIQDARIPFGLGIHGESHYETPLPANAKALSIGVGTTTNAHCSSGLIFEIYADEKQLYQRELQKVEFEWLKLPVSSAQKLR